MSAAWFVDGAYAFKCWQKLGRPDYLDYIKLRTEVLERRFIDASRDEKIGEAYYFNSDRELPSTRQDAFEIHPSHAFPVKAGI